MYVTQGLKRAAQVRGDTVATCDGDRARTWRECAQRVARLAAALRGFGVVDGERAAILALNGDRYYEAIYGTAWAGGVFVPVNTRLAPAEIAYWVSDSESRALFCDDAFAPAVRRLKDEGAIPSVERIVWMGTGNPPDGAVSHDALIDAADPAEDAGRGYDDLAGLFYTGGTTGRSKGVMLSHRNLVFNAFNTFSAFRIDVDARWLHAAPMFHIADCAAVFGITQTAGSHYFIPAFDPVAVMRATERYRVTDQLLVPTMCNMLVNHPDIGKYDLSSLRHVVYGASPMPDAVILKAMEALPDCSFSHAYGQTECAPLVTACGPEYHVMEGPHAHRYRSVGQAVPGVEIKVVDKDGAEAPRGEVGEIAVRGANVMMGYWRRPDLTEEALRDGWMHTGDGGTMTEDGFVYVVDRMKDMIISGGENVYSAEVENAVHEHPAVAECAAIGVPDEKWGERVHAVVRLKDGETLDGEAVMAHCRERIAGFKCPRSVEFRTEPMPLSGAGKILKTELRKPWWRGRDKQVN